MTHEGPAAMEQEALSHDALRAMLAAQRRFHETQGREGARADLGMYVVEDFDFSGENLAETNMRESVFRRCRFVGCDLYGAYFNDSVLAGSDFSRAMLSKAEFIEADAHAACFDDATLVQTEFIETNLSSATFRRADLSAAVIARCDLTGAIFDAANLAHAGLRDNVGQTI